MNTCEPEREFERKRLLRIEDWEQLARQARFRPSDIAALCPISLRQLERFFAARFNTTPRTWAKELKCRLARQLISQGWSNKAAAGEIGFADESHLCHEFKRVYGAPPQRFAPLYQARVDSGMRKEGRFNGL
jgi:AraC-like DNA-binding protein